MPMFIIIDWQNEKDIVTIRDTLGRTKTFTTHWQAIAELVNEVTATGNNCLQIVEIK